MQHCKGGESKDPNRPLWDEKSPDRERAKQALISRLRTKHVKCGHYLHRIGKRPTKECQCGAADQSVPHILLGCGLNREARRQAKRDLHTRTLTMTFLLYSREGMEAAVKIWGKFEEARFEYEVVVNEDRDADEADE